MTRKLPLNPSVLAAVLLLAACGQQDEQAAGTTGSAAPDPEGLAPHETVEQSAVALRNNDIRGFLKLTLPDDKYADMRDQWAQKKQEPIEPEEKQEYEAMMERLTKDGAEEELMAELKPQLDQMRQQMPMYVGMFQGIAQSAIAQSEDMTETQREQAQSALSAVTGWAQRTDLASPDLAEQAISVICDTARDLDLPTLEDVRALDFDEMLGKSGQLASGLKEALAVYELNVDELLDSVEAETVSQNGETATVRTTFQFLDTDQTVDGQLVKVNDRWVSKEAMEADMVQKAAAE